ncbi:hypothetical protein ADUPG1_010376 [Aduncisulcus paluster]|uniref:C3H1-type domain-containing protein n=1 Tax=Aduncisulcus paluster TaxID=2918883 RepID=A0ABQ5JRN9_9EUKA|nr:hypothetical protein ADUPG1_010376 [Aduncisulcus paluster]|eukprot:gnl/Carplike_NY0171/704_a972_2247.p1 GENE.gnl/Carplike_NY0171/704_a972_2247~~gnl/Carplike_NY0171/704_a972_2247.p1  ORF type:complete len:160 (-),score=14.13 gnl/Carplike_NY0171/704_a972_2247:395-874(-)
MLSVQTPIISKDFSIQSEEDSFIRHKRDASESHDRSESDEVSTSYSVSFSASRSPSSKPSDTKSRLFYKTELCNSYMEYGHCPYGSKCCFAHGIHELRSRTASHGAVAQKCKAFHSNGVCNYGRRCRFCHEEHIFYDIYPKFAQEGENFLKFGYKFDFE